MSSIQEIVKLSLITKRQDIINFTEAMCADKIKLTIASDFKSISVSETKIVLIDASVFSDFDLEALEYGERYADFSICLLPIDIPKQVVSYVEKNFQNIISFPVDTAFFQSYCIRVKRELNKHKNQNLIHKKDQLSIPDSFFGYFCGNSTAIRTVRGQIMKAVYSEDPVLILGETGVGKTKAARVIHDLSVRHIKQMKTVEPSVMVGTLPESALFGHVRGSYTGADYDRRGYFEEANGSTLFFDEFGIAPPAVQAMLLTVLETGVYKPIGDNKERHVNVRMIFATNADVQRMIAAGEFRYDLYCRINDNEIHIPPLRDHKEDIRGMVMRYIESKATITEEALEMLEEYSWPGNIRELHKCLKRAVENSSNNVITAESIDFRDINILQ